MKRVTGIGGVFFRGKDAVALREWYRQHLGVAVEDWGGTVFRWQSADHPSGNGSTTWNIFEHDTEYFGAAGKAFMINFRVADLHGLLKALRSEGCAVDAKVEESEFGKFGWVTDPEGNRVELWEPPAGQ